MWEAIGKILLGPLVDGAVKVFSIHTQGKVDEMKLRADLYKQFGIVFQEVAKSDNEAATKMFDAFQQTLRTSKVVQAVWAYWMASQITFLIWLEFGIPFYSHVTGHTYPGVGTLDQWAYAGVMAGIGLGPYVLKKAQQPVLPKL